MHSVTERELGLLQRTLTSRKQQMMSITSRQGNGFAKSCVRTVSNEWHYRSTEHQ